MQSIHRMIHYILRITIFFYPDYTVGFGLSPNPDLNLCQVLRSHARGLYRRSGISPRPEDFIQFIKFSIYICFILVKYICLHSLLMHMICYEILENKLSSFLYHTKPPKQGKDYKRPFQVTLLTGGGLNAYLADIDRQAQERMERLTEQMKRPQGITE